MAPPHYNMLWAETIPRFEGKEAEAGVVVTTISGALGPRAESAAAAGTGVLLRVHEEAYPSANPGTAGLASRSLGFPPPGIIRASVY